MANGGRLQRLVMPGTITCPTCPLRLPILKVQVKCAFRTTGYKIRLQQRQPQGINSKDLLLERIVEEPDAAEDRVTTESVCYEEETDLEYETLTILPHGVAVSVQNVH